jgi:hypothetical protein
MRTPTLPAWRSPSTEVCLLGCYLATERNSMARKTTKKPSGPKPPKEYGKESGTFAKPHPVKPGACPTCGATPPCH